MTDAQHQKLLEKLKDKRESTDLSIAASLFKSDSLLLCLLGVNMLDSFHVWRWFNSSFFSFFFKDPGHIRKQILFASERAKRHGLMLRYERRHDRKANVWYFSLGLGVEHSISDCQGHEVRHCCLLLPPHSSAPFFLFLFYTEIVQQERPFVDVKRPRRPISDSMPTFRKQKRSNV